MGGPVVAVVPSRFASTRFPGKPLALIDGVPMVIRVIRRASSAQLVDRVFVATDDERIAQVVREHNFEVVMTSKECASGTDRIAEAVTQLQSIAPKLVVNVQGDEPLLDPADIDQLISETLKSQQPMGTLARVFDSLERFKDPNVVKVVRANSGQALYFSRSPIPNNPSKIDGLPLMHIGLYAYVPHALRKLASQAPTDLEICERLEQLRALETGINIHVALAASARSSIAVDVPEDVARVEDALRNIG
ncbi:MAG: 3-deoxy-manno-octulosonate cytidylyltransferase [Myxococcota bacterium]|nr:3-deoxy-manno-octulosonate cytidylyltransferase [Myxococcota bacterium]